MKRFLAERSLLLLGIAVAICLLGAPAHGEDVSTSGRAPATISLRDQYDHAQRLHFPGTNVIVLTIADKQGADQVDDWVAAFKPLAGETLRICGLADVSGVPGFLKNTVRRKFQEVRKYPVMLDWTGDVCARFQYHKNVANILIIDQDGVIRARFSGKATPESTSAAPRVLKTLINPAPTPP
jgi:hypothetical protein